MRLTEIISDNHLILLSGGSEYFPELIRRIDQAQSEIFFETYIFYPDEIGRQVMQAFYRAASRGVKVHVIADWFGTGIGLCRMFYREFKKYGVQFRTFNPWFYRGLARQHRKVCVIDKTHAFVGGINILEDLRYDYSEKDRFLSAPRWDFAVSIEGPLLKVIHDEVESFWERTGHMPFVSRLEHYRRRHFKRRFALAKMAVAGFVVRDNLHNRLTIQRAYLHAMGAARKQIVLATPYFAPGRKFRAALCAAAMRGVEVIVLIGSGEFWWQDALAQSFVPQMLKNGVRLFEYRKTQLHGKVAVMDDVWATVGSSNCDGLSLFVNHEANVIVRDTAFAINLRQHFFRTLADATEIFIADYEKRPWFKRVLSGVVFRIYHFVMRLVTWGGYN